MNTPMFENYFSYDDFVNIVNVVHYEHERANPDYGKIIKAGQVFTHAVINYLKNRSKLGLLELPENTECHKGRIVTAWKNLLSEELTEYDVEQIESLFKNIIHYDATMYSNEHVTENDYARFIKFVNAGNFSVCDLVISDSECTRCGQRMRLMSEHWKFVFSSLYVNNDLRAIKTELKPCINDALFSVDVNFPSGELIIADWIYIKEFTDRVKYSDYEISINFALGRKQSTEHAAKLGFVTVHVGNSNPNVFKSGDELIFGHDIDDLTIGGFDGFDDIGRVCSNVWNVTVIDKMRLIDIISQETGKERALQLVQELDHGEIEIKVAPGNYRISYSPLMNSIGKFDNSLPKKIDVLVSMKPVF